MSATLNSTGGGSLWVAISGCSLWSRFIMLGSSEHPKGPYSKLMVKLFSKNSNMWCRYLNVTDGRTTDRQTDDFAIAIPRST